MKYAFRMIFVLSIICLILLLPIEAIIKVILFIITGKCDSEPWFLKVINYEEKLK